jgi:hypothetical protein
MATVYEVHQQARSLYWQGGAWEETGFKDVAADAALTLKDQRVSLVDPTAGAVKVTLPAQPYPGYCQDVREVAGSANAITIDGNGYNIDGNPSIIMSTPYARRKVQFVAASDSAPAQYILIEKVF